MEIAVATAPIPERSRPTHASVQTAVLAWYQRQGRDLPWRRTTDPYAVLVAEFMLQQTQVERVIPKYQAFLELYPSLAALAAAPTADVIRAWAGLGYNRRAVNLQGVARQVLAEHAGVIPTEPAVLEGLQGIGRYTAGAVACFGYRRDVAFLDTNIRRLLHRVYYGPEVPEPRAGERVLWELAAAALPAGQGYPWNQGLMDLGAMICTAQRPLCPACPLVDHCCAAPVFLQYGLPARAHRALREQRANYQARETTAFKQTSRYFRGRIVAILRDLPVGTRLALDELGPRVRDDYDAEQHAVWLVNLVKGLIRDRLIQSYGPDEGLRLALPE